MGRVNDERWLDEALNQALHSADTRPDFQKWIANHPEAIEKLTGAGLVVKDVVVLVDRQSGAKESLAEAGYSMHAVLTINEMLDHWEQTSKVEKEKITATRKFLSN